MSRRFDSDSRLDENLPMIHSRLSAVEGISCWNYDGDLNLLGYPTGAILLSRQSRRPKPTDWWLHATIEAMAMLAKEGRAVVCGGGILHLDFARWAAYKAAGTILVDVPGGASGKLSAGPPEWSHLRIEPVISTRCGKVETMTERDKWIAVLADKIIAVEVRAGGNMEALGKWAAAAGKEVFVIEPPRATSANRGNANLSEAGARSLQIRVSPIHEEQITQFPQKEEPAQFDGAVLKDYLWHFTRECAGPWPGQTWDEYFSDLAAGAPGAAHEAVDSLERILHKGIINAVGRIVRGGHKAVCFSARSPLELAANPVYRKSLARWDFKPYAVGIRRDVASQLGAKPVRYCAEEDYPEIPGDEKYLFQLSTGKKSDWRREEEWRTSGDINLNSIDPAEVLILVHNSAEKERIGKISRFPVVSFKEILPGSA